MFFLDFANLQGTLGTFFNYFEQLGVEGVNLSAPTGEFAGLFVQEPQREFTNGLPVRVGSEEPVNYWRKATEAIEEAVLDGDIDLRDVEIIFVDIPTCKRRQW